jgi:hypothetical protein
MSDTWPYDLSILLVRFFICCHGICCNLFKRIDSLEDCILMLWQSGSELNHYIGDLNYKTTTLGSKYRHLNGLFQPEPDIQKLDIVKSARDKQDYQSFWTALCALITGPESEWSFQFWTSKRIDPCRPISGYWMVGPFNYWNSICSVTECFWSSDVRFLVKCQ